MDNDRLAICVAIAFVFVCLVFGMGMAEVIFKALS